MRVMRASIVVGLLAVLAIVPAAPAQAGEYVVYACQVNGHSVPMTGWSAYTSPDDVPLTFNDCATGGRFGFSSATVVSGARAGWTFTPPSNTSVVLVRFADAKVSIGGLSYRFGGAPLGLFAPGADPVPLDTSQASDQPNSWVELWCSRPDEACNASGELTAATAETVLRDPHAPSGSFVDGAPILTFSDEGAGVERIEMSVDGADPVSTTVGPESCRRPFVSLVPCALSGRIEWPLPAGRHEIRATLIDASGNRTAVGPEHVGTEEPASPSAPVTAETVQPRQGRVMLTRRGTLRVRYAKPPTIHGTVTANDGAPLGGVTVTTSDGTRAKTDAKGRFSVKLGKGVSREVRISYGDSVQTVKVIVAAPVRLKTDKKSTRNGRSIAFTGSVPGAGNARTRVELQALANRKWVPFKSVALRNGRFRARYRFQRTFSTQRYSFRAVAYDGPGFPYATGESSLVKVVVHA